MKFEHWSGSNLAPAVTGPLGWLIRLTPLSHSSPSLTPAPPPAPTHSYSTKLSSIPMPVLSMGLHVYTYATVQMMKECAYTHTHAHTLTHICTRTRTRTHTQHTHTHTHTSSVLLAPRWRRPVSKADRLSNGWAGQAHARQPWGEWLPGTLAIKMAFFTHTHTHTHSHTVTHVCLHMPTCVPTHHVGCLHPHTLPYCLQLKVSSKCVLHSICNCRQFH